MRSHNTVLIVLLVICSQSSQYPLIFSKQNYKGLKSIVPHSESFANGVFRAVYYHDQAVAVVYINQNNEVQNCDIIEVYEPCEAMEVLSNLSISSRPMEIPFSQMTNLMRRCQLLDAMQIMDENSKHMPKGALERANILGTNALNLFLGIMPGTKWCGTGDVADNYHDLGMDTDVDRCCRTHDLCPIKIRPQRSRYNLTNYSLYSKSHCDCDSALYHCLKQIDSPSANIMGQLYFNIVKVSCIEDIPEQVMSSKLSSKRFITTQLTF